MPTAACWNSSHTMLSIIVFYVQRCKPGTATATFSIIYIYYSRKPAMEWGFFLLSVNSFYTFDWKLNIVGVTMQCIAPIALVMWYGGSIIKAQIAKRTRFFKLIKYMFWTVVIVFIMCRRINNKRISRFFRYSNNECSSFVCF